MPGPLKQIAVAVADVARSRDFYRDKVGLKLLFEAPPGLAFFDLGGVWLMLSQATEQEPAAPGSVLYFGVDDIGKTYQEMKANDVAFIDHPHRVADMGSYTLWLTFFKDPDGTTLALRSEVPN